MKKKQVYIQTVNVIGRGFFPNVELAIKHKKAGDDVHMIVCKGDLYACTPNSRHDELACMLCRSKLNRTLRLPELDGISIHEMHLNSRHIEFEKPDVNNIDDLKNFFIEDINHGLEATSSVITVLGDPRPELSGEKDLVNANLTNAVAVYRWMIEFFNNRECDLFYIYNGRYSSQMPAIRAARYYDIPIATFELFHDNFKYVLVKGTDFHNIEHKKKEIETFWQNDVPLDEKEKIGGRFYEERRYGDISNFIETIYKSGQEPGLLPKNFDRSARNIVIYNSSEDEFAAIEGYENPVYSNQMVGLRQILDDPNLSRDIQLWLRVHPHLANRPNNSQLKDIENLNHPRLHKIKPTEKVDTYELMENAEKVLTFGSTMSVESAFAGIPTIIIGRESYTDLGSCYAPKTHKEVMELINRKNLSPLPKLGAIKFGYWTIEREINYNFFNPKDETVGGVYLRANLILKYFTKFWWSWYGHKLRSIMGFKIN